MSGEPQGQVAAPAPQSQAPTIPPEIQQRLNRLLGDLIIEASDLAFELADLDCEKSKECPVAKSCKRIVKVIKQIRETLKAVPS